MLNDEQIEQLCWLMVALEDEDGDKGDDDTFIYEATTHEGYTSEEAVWFLRQGIDYEQIRRQDYV